MANGPAKSAGALRPIGALSAETGLPQHILRYWETRFPELKPLQRAGNRRYYRPEDVALVKRIDRLLNREGYTVRGVQGLLKQGGQTVEAAAPQSAAPAIDFDGLAAIRALLVGALAADAQGA